MNTSPTNQKLARTIEAFARDANIGRTMVYAAIKSGKLRAKKYGKRTLILDQDGREFLNSLPELQPA